MILKEYTTYYWKMKWIFSKLFIFFVLNYIGIIRIYYNMNLNTVSYLILINGILLLIIFILYMYEINDFIWLLKMHLICTKMTNNRIALNKIQLTIYKIYKCILYIWRWYGNFFLNLFVYYRPDYYVGRPTSHKC